MRNVPPGTRTASSGSPLMPPTLPRRDAGRLPGPSRGSHEHRERREDPDAHPGHDDPRPEQEPAGPPHPGALGDRDEEQDEREEDREEGVVVAALVRLQ